MTTVTMQKFTAQINELLDEAENDSGTLLLEREQGNCTTTNKQLIK